MSDLISRQDAIKAIEDLPNCYNGFSDTYDKAYIIGVIEEVPSAERVGHWIKTTEGEYCSYCGAFPYDDGEYHIMGWRSDYCPHCGARMKERKND